MPGIGSDGDDLSFTTEYRKNEVKRMDFEKFKESLIEDVQQVVSSHLTLDIQNGHIRRIRHYRSFFARFIKRNLNKNLK